jgi:rhodanese-related sulfurtransferase
MPVQNIKPQDAIELIKTGAVFVDVREKHETECNKYALSNITYLPLSEFEMSFKNIIPTDKSAPIILACQAGGRSMMAAGFLFKNGYNNLSNLDGGLSRWTAEGFPTDGEANLKTDCCSKPGCC